MVEGNIAPCFRFAVVLIVIECAQVFLGESLYSFAIDSIFCSLFMVLIDNHSFVAVLMLTYAVLDAVSWATIGTAMTFRFLQAVQDIAYGLRDTPKYFTGGALAVFGLFAFAHFPVGNVRRVRGWVARLLLPFCGIFGFLFLQERLNSLYPFRHSSQRGSLQGVIRNAFGASLSARARRQPLRNLILIQAESFELSYLGQFNPKWPLTMPWLSRQTHNCSYFTHVQSQPYTTWSSAGLFVTQCGFPLVVSDVRNQARNWSSWDRYASLKCMPDILRSLGYTLYAYGSGPLEVMEMKAFFVKRGYQTYDSAEHFRESDDDFFDLLQEEVLPMLSNPRMWPFVLHVLNADTHTPYIRIAAKCNDYLRHHGYPRVYRSFNCLDQYLERFFDAVRKNGLEDDTEVVIFGDHLTVAWVQRDLNVDRNLTLIFPFRKQDDKWRRAAQKPLTYYDVVPTILELLEIDYSPKFPFGADIFGPDIGRPPAFEDQKAIYDIAMAQVNTANRAWTQAKKNGA
jgi:hypothetical protein